ncbi:MAG: pyruvate carboxyltransferase [Planctomycetes bacterium]|nr:pyruvate carboxyltransferase [Planctomycetota bacterium]
MPFVRMGIHYQKRKGVVHISDTTLRDGEQTLGVRFRPEAKVAIVRALARAGVHSIDAGFPAAAPEEIEAIRRITLEARGGPVITALCRTVHSDIDRAAEALQARWFNKKGVTLFLGVSPQHRQYKHGKSKAEIVQIAVDAITYARRFFTTVAFGPEDASRAEPDFLHEVYREAIAAGASSVGFTDTVGILTPEKAADRIKGIQDTVPNLGHALLGVHFHNDLGLATANALACVAQGVDVVQGTINGLGERAGNTALEEVVMALHLHRDQYGVDCGVNPHHLYELSRLVARLGSYSLPPNKPVVGDNLFLTEAGIHQDGLLKDVSTYVPFLPEEIGAGPVHLVLGKHSGRHAVRHCLEQLGRNLTEEQVQKVLDHLKDGAAKPAYASEADFDLLLREVFGEPEKVPPGSS